MTFFNQGQLCVGISPSLEATHLSVNEGDQVQSQSEYFNLCICFHPLPAFLSVLTSDHLFSQSLPVQETENSVVVEPFEIHSGSKGES